MEKVVYGGCLLCPLYPLLPQVMTLTWLLLIQQMYLFISTKYHRKKFYSKIVATSPGFLQFPL